MANSKKKQSLNWQAEREFITEYLALPHQTKNGSLGSRFSFNNDPIRLCIGLSGGLDSCVLLHWLASLRDELHFDLSAVHIHHGLSPNADHWAQTAVQFAASLNIKCAIHHVDLSHDIGDLGIEGAARKARYAIYAEQNCSAIVLAHHQNDQAETILINLLRGSGPAGLAAMPMQRELNDKTTLLRPLLTQPRSELLHYAQTHALQWIEDESNQDRHYKRNAIRHELMPIIMGISPKALTTLTRSAIHQSEANELLIEIAEQDWATCRDGNALSLVPWQTLSKVRQKNVLRHWLGLNEVVLELRAFNELLRTAIDAADDMHPALVWRNIAVRRYKNQLHVTHASLLPGPTQLCPFDPLQPHTDLPDWHGTIHWQPVAGGIAQSLLLTGFEVRGRSGGEQFKLTSNRPTRSLKAHCQAAQIAPWLRETTPLLYINVQLAAMPGLGVNHQFIAPAGEIGWLPTWHPYQPKV